MSLVEMLSDEPKLPNFNCLSELNDYHQPTQLPFLGWDETQYGMGKVARLDETGAGLGHNYSPDSIMNPASLYERQPKIITAQDIKIYKVNCTVPTPTPRRGRHRIPIPFVPR